MGGIYYINHLPNGRFIRGLPTVYLVGGLKHFSIQLGMSSSQLTKSIIFQRGRLKPPTRYVIPQKYNVRPPR